MKFKISLFIVLVCLIFSFVNAADVSSDVSRDNNHVEARHVSTGEKLAKWLESRGVNPYLIVALIATLPIVELRGAIPVGVLFLKLNWIGVILLSIVGNMIPIFFVLFIFKYFEVLFRKINFFDTLLDRIFEKTLAKNKTIEDYEEVGLMMFVGIPLPVTGAWTGSLIAYLMKLSYKKSILFIFLGVLISASIVSLLTYFIPEGFKLFG